MPWPPCSRTCRLGSTTTRSRSDKVPSASVPNLRLPCSARREMRHVPCTQVSRCPVSDTQRGSLCGCVCVCACAYQRNISYNNRVACVTKGFRMQQRSPIRIERLRGARAPACATTSISTQRMSPVGSPDLSPISLRSVSDSIWCVVSRLR